MNLSKTLKRFVSAASAAALLVTGAVIVPVNNSVVVEVDADAATPVTIDTKKTYQYIRGFGGINHPEWTADKGGDLNAAQRQAAFGNGDNQLGLTVLRVFVNPDKNAWKNAVPTAKYVSDLGYTVFASPWEPPSNLAASGGTGGKKGKLHLPESNYGAYAQHLNDFGNYMKNQGVDLYSISVQNEPDYADEWTAWTTDQTTKFIAEYGDKITSTRLMSPESFQYGAWNDGKDYYNKILNNAKAMANCDLFGTHFYGTPRSKMDFPALESCGKEIWMTEVYVPNSTGNSANNWPEALEVGVNVHNAMVVGNMSAYVWWTIRRSYGPLTDDGVPSKRGWNIAQFSKWVRPGSYRIDCTENPQNNINGDKNTGTYVSAYLTPNKQVVAVAVNNTDTEFNQVFNLKNGEQIKQVDRYRTSANENVAATKDMNHDASGFNAQLPARSISTFVITLSDSTEIQTPTEPSDDPDDNGMYFHHEFEQTDENWSGRGTATVETSGRFAYEGKETLAVRNREAGWHGGIFTLPKAFKAGEEYSFSAQVIYADGPEARDFKLTLEYTNSDGDTTWDEIASGTVNAEKWLQLANTNYKIPAGASNCKIIVETTDDTLQDFYIDCVAGAVKGTKIEGSGQPEVVTQPTTKPFDPDDYIPGDITNDGRVDVYDVIAMRKGILDGSLAALPSADVDANGEVAVNDLVLIANFVLGKKVTLQKGNIVVTKPAGKMLTISQYTPIAAAQLTEFESNDSKQKKNGVNYGTVEKKSYYSNFCGRNKPYNVLLPANYDKNKKYPVLYVMHGYWENQNRMLYEGNDYIPTQEIIGNLIAEGKAEEMIVVFPYIYSSKTQDNCDGMNDANNQAYDNFDTVLTTELMPLIEKEYSVATGRENTAITGFSMGGRESLMIGQKHPDLFGYVGAICAAPGASGQWKFASEEAAPSLILITAGSNDQTVYDNPKNYNENFKKNGVPTVWHYVNGGYHGDNCIRAHLYNFAQMVFKADKQ